MGASAPDSVRRLVDLFDRERKVYQSPDYKEEQLRAEFLNPFFESLGWDVANKAGLTGACPERSRRVFKPVASSDASDNSDLNSQSLWSLPSLLSVLSLLRSASGA
jgi:hypothetical protein